MGQEPRQNHRFPCVECGEDMVVALNVDFVNISYDVEAVENAELVKAVDDAPVVNVEANFIIPKDQRNVDNVFPRMDEFRKMMDVAERNGSLRPIGHLTDIQLRSRPNRQPDFQTEWKLLRKAWSLHRRGREHLVKDKIAAASEEFYASDPLKSLPDWLWRFLLFFSQPHFELTFQSAMKRVGPLIGTPAFDAFETYYKSIAAKRGDRYFELFENFFEAYDDLAQVHFYVVRGIPIPPGDVISHVDFKETRMLYGNLFEAFSSSVDVLVCFNNMIAGRSFDALQTIPLKEYLKLDKAGRFRAFEDTPEFAALCTERDNQLRNASHHLGTKLDTETQTIVYRAGKGGLGDEQKLAYGQYLARCDALFLQCVALLRMEIMVCHSRGLRFPL